MENVTRDVIADLWPLYVAGEASPDTRTLIEVVRAPTGSLSRSLRRWRGNACRTSPPHRSHQTTN